eukprot:g2373.t1
MTDASPQLADVSCRVPIVYGSIATWLGKKASDFKTHQWTLFVRPFEAPPSTTLAATIQQGNTSVKDGLSLKTPTLDTTSVKFLDNSAGGDFSHSNNSSLSGVTTTTTGTASSHVTNNGGASTGATRAAPSSTVAVQPEQPPEILPPLPKSPFASLAPIISKVVFQLHPSFKNPTRVVTEPPFQVTEFGWGEFEVGVKIFFQDPFIPPLEILYQLKLYHTNQTMSMKRPVVTQYYDEIVIEKPSLLFYQVLKRHLLSNDLKNASYLNAVNSARLVNQIINSKAQQTVNTTSSSPNPIETTTKESESTNEAVKVGGSSKRKGKKRSTRSSSSSSSSATAARAGSDTPMASAENTGSSSADNDQKARNPPADVTLKLPFIQLNPDGTTEVSTSIESVSLIENEKGRKKRKYNDVDATVVKDDVSLQDKTKSSKRIQKKSLSSSSSSSNSFSAVSAVLPPTIKVEVDQATGLPTIPVNQTAIIASTLMNGIDHSLYHRMALNEEENKDHASSGDLTKGFRRKISTGTTGGTTGGTVNSTVTGGTVENLSTNVTTPLSDFGKTYLTEDFINKSLLAKRQAPSNNSSGNSNTKGGRGSSGRGSSGNRGGHKNNSRKNDPYSYGSRIGGSNDEDENNKSGVGRIDKAFDKYSLALTNDLGNRREDVLVANEDVLRADMINGMEKFGNVVQTLQNQKYYNATPVIPLNHLIQGGGGSVANANGVNGGAATGGSSLSKSHDVIPSTEKHKTTTDVYGNTYLPITLADVNGLRRRQQANLSSSLDGSSSSAGGGTGAGANNVGPSSSANLNNEMNSVSGNSSNKTLSDTTTTGVSDKNVLFEPTLQLPNGALQIIGQGHHTGQASSGGVAGIGNTKTTVNTTSSSSGNSAGGNKSQGSTTKKYTKLNKNLMLTTANDGVPLMKAIGITQKNSLETTKPGLLTSTSSSLAYLTSGTSGAISLAGPASKSGAANVANGSAFPHSLDQLGLLDLNQIAAEDWRNPCFSELESIRRLASAQAFVTRELNLLKERLAWWEMKKWEKSLDVKREIGEVEIEKNEKLFKEAREKETERLKNDEESFNEQEKIRKEEWAKEKKRQEEEAERARKRELERIQREKEQKAKAEQRRQEEMDQFIKEKQKRSLQAQLLSLSSDILPPGSPGAGTHRRLTSPPTMTNKNVQGMTLASSQTNAATFGGSNALDNVFNTSNTNLSRPPTTTVNASSIEKTTQSTSVVQVSPSSTSFSSSSSYSSVALSSNMVIEKSSHTSVEGQKQSTGTRTGITSTITTGGQPLLGTAGSLVMTKGPQSSTGELMMKSTNNKASSLLSSKPPTSAGGLHQEQSSAVAPSLIPPNVSSASNNNTISTSSSLPSSAAAAMSSGGVTKGNALKEQSKSTTTSGSQVLPNNNLIKQTATAVPLSLSASTTGGTMNSSSSSGDLNTMAPPTGSHDKGTKLVMNSTSGATTMLRSNDKTREISTVDSQTTSAIDPNKGMSTTINPNKGMSTTIDPNKGATSASDSQGTSAINPSSTTTGNSNTSLDNKATTGTTETVTENKKDVGSVTSVISAAIASVLSSKKKDTTK